MFFNLLRILYSVCYFLSLPLIFFRLCWKSRKLKAYRDFWLERLGINTLEKSSELWVHAVSLGEVIGISPFIEQYLKEYPAANVLITVSTPTGRERAIQRFKGHPRVSCCYLPYDLQCLYQKLIKRVKPKLMVIMETEIWPNLFYTLEKHKIPILIANGRLSPQSHTNYRRFKPFFKWLLAKNVTVAAQSEEDRVRFVEIGLPKERTSLMGNLKFELGVAKSVFEKGAKLKESCQGRRVFVFGSTHDGEEKAALDVFKVLKQDMPDLLLVIVPRHPDRFTEVSRLCETNGYSVIRRSQSDFPLESTDVFVGDTMGELMIYYYFADVVFVGGSLSPIGGHNLLEPASLGKSVLTGPHLHNFVAISNILFRNGGACLVENTEQLTNTARALLQDSSKRDAIGEKAKQVVDENSGAMANLIKEVRRLLQY